jgi:NAD(P)-dependent dehydrogenase (short-subunit alcohol dehydrogenase family)
MNKTAVITGAGSGVGRAIALGLVRQGWRVAILGRHANKLEETRRLALTHAPLMEVFPCDIADAAQVAAMAQGVLSALGSVEVLVNSAGTNTPKRCLAELSHANYRLLVETNMTGAYLCAQAFLSGMRARQSGTIVNIVSDAAKQASAKAGPAYVMSKCAMAGLTQSINAEERGMGIRACSIFPGDIDTPLLELRPTPPTTEAREKMLQPEDVAQCALLVIQMPARVIVEEILLRPR